MSEKNTLSGGAFVGIDAEDLLRVSKILAGIPGGAQKAVGAALSRAASSGKTDIKGIVTSEYTISKSTFLKQTRSITHFTRNADGKFEVVVEFAGNVIPLTQFDTAITREGIISTRVKTASAKTALDNAFYAKMGAHNGVFERLGSEHFPVEEKYGPSTPQMMYSNDAVLEKMEKRMSEVYDVRIEHEIDRLLNGWGR